MPFLSGWGKRKEIRYGTVFPASNLTDFPILINITSDSDIATELTSGGGITITGSDETTELPFGLYPSSDPTSGDLIIRFKSNVSTSAATGDIIGYLYYDSLQTTTEDKAGVVTNDYAAVLVPGDYGSGDICEDWVSGTKFAGTGGLDATDLISAPVGQGWSFDGSDDCIILNSIAANLPDIDAEKTYEIWLQHAGDTSRHMILSSVLNDGGGAGNSQDVEVSVAFGQDTIGIAEWGNAMRATIFLDGGGGNASVPADTWFYFAFGQSSGWTSYVTDVDDQDPTVFDPTTSSQTGAVGAARIGSFNGTFSGPFANRPIGEIRVSTVKRADAWREYAYYNDANNSDTVTLGAEETDSGTGTTTTDANVVLSPLTSTGILVAPVVVTGNILGLSPLNASGSLQTQTITTGNQVTLDAVTSSGSIAEPTVSAVGDVTVSPDPITAVGAIVSPSVEVGVSVSLTPTTATGTLQTLTVVPSNQITLDALSSRGDIVQPSLTLSNIVTMTPVTARGRLVNVIVDDGGEEPEPPILGARYTLDFRDLTGTLSNTTTLSGTLNYR